MKEIMKFLKTAIITALSIALAAWLLPNVQYGTIATLILAALVLTLLQKIIEPLLKLLFLPINIVTFGLFSLVINVFILWLASYLVPAFVIMPIIILGVSLNIFFTLLFFSFVLSLFQSILKKIL